MSERQIARLPSRHEAELIAAQLEVCGIDSRLIGDDCGGVDPALSFTNGCRVMVDSNEAERALELLAESDGTEVLGFTIGLERRLAYAELESILAAHYPTATISQAFPQDQPLPETNIAVELQEHESEFKTALIFWFFPTDADGVRDVEPALAALLAKAFGCRAICDGTGRGPDDRDDPYWSIVTDGTSFWLADDRDSAWADGDGGPVRLVGDLTLDLPPLS